MVTKIKPLARWTIGNVEKEGFKCLAMSIKTFQTIYPEFDLILCHNNLNQTQIEFINQIEIEKHEQKKIEGMFNPTGVAWKLYPPRLTEGKELFIDNDLILMERIEEIDNFIQGKHFIYTECNLLTPYGNYKHLVKKGFQLNSGLFGLPENFDFKKEIVTIMKNSKFNQWQDEFDEQGMVASIISKQKSVKISNTTIKILGPRIKTFSKAKGYHFVKLNSGFKKHWSTFTNEA